MPETQYFEHTLKLSQLSEPRGIEFPAKLAYWTFGDVKNPAVMLPTCFAGTLATTTPNLYEGPQAPVSTSAYFVIVVGLLGGSESSSPSNQAAPYNGPNFPHVTYEDNIRLQKALCDHLGVKKLSAYIGFSMGGQQAYHMATLFPDFVERIGVLAGSAKTSWHNWSFLEGPKAALVNSVDFHDGHYTSPPIRGARAFSRVYSTWALCQEWYRQQCWKTLGFDSLEEYLQAYWNGKGDANDLLCLLWTWQHGDIGLYHPEDGGDISKTLPRIKARCALMPSRTDQYFPPEDSEFEVKHLKNGELHVIESIWGHLAGGYGGTKEDKKFIEQEIAKHLSS
ncbi:hypothetical protein AAFC00_003635 [Neodothiora populina]|uniref:AB hydrolase-1 domain-containing protein n=1 Tax=Neodothiora populina TaxID=2781224 RepID=A0ABR3PEY6_9PEZI